MVKIGVFDSGMGGLSVAKAIEQAFPDYEIEFVHDAEHLPYGNKSPEELLKLVFPILTPLARRSDIIVIACNTLTTNVIGMLRHELSVPIIGIEPMIKPAAALTKSGVLAVCATPATLASKRYAYLKQTYAGNLKVLEPDCTDWAMMIQSNQVRRQHIYEQIDTVCKAGADVIVLGCTHYHWIEEMVKDAAAGRAVVIQPEQAIVKRLKQVIAKL